MKETSSPFVHPPHRVQAPVDAIAILHRLAPTGAQALHNLDSLTRFLEECLSNITVEEEEEGACEAEADLRPRFESGPRSLRGAACRPPHMGHMATHGDTMYTNLDEDVDGVVLDGSGEQEATGRSGQWIACVRHIFLVCMPHVEAAQVRGAGDMQGGMMHARGVLLVTFASDIRIP